MSEQKDEYKCGQSQMSTNEGQMKLHSQAGINKNEHASRGWVQAWARPNECKQRPNEGAQPSGCKQA